MICHEGKVKLDSWSHEHENFIHYSLVYITFLYLKKNLNDFLCVKEFNIINLLPACLCWQSYDENILIVSGTFTKIFYKDNTLAKEIKILDSRGFTSSIFIGFLQAESSIIWSNLKINLYV